MGKPKKSDLNVQEKAEILANKNNTIPGTVRLALLTDVVLAAAEKSGIYTPEGKTAEASDGK